MAYQPLDDLELNTIEAFLESNRVHKECHNFIMAHGFLTALAICPSHSPKAQWLSFIFEETPSFTNKKEAEQITQLLSRLFLDIRKALESEDRFLIPCELEISTNSEELSELQEWASGFMESVFMKERFWFETERKEVIAELLLPIMVASDLFDNEEIVQIRENQKTTQSCINRIPDIITDLFLFLQTESAKHANNTQPGKQNKKKKTNNQR